MKFNQSGKAISFLYSLCFIGMLAGIWYFSINFRIDKVITSMLFAMTFIGLAYIKNIWLKLFLLWTIIRTAMGFVPVSYAGLVFIFIYIMLIQTGIDKLRRDYIPTILNIICGLALLQAIAMVLNYNGIWFIVLPLGAIGNVIPRILEVDLSSTYKVVTGFLSNTNMASVFLALSLPAFFRRKLFWLIPVVFIGLYIANSSGGMIPAIFALCAFVLWKIYGKNKLASFSLLGIAILITFYFIFKVDSPFYHQGRLVVWGEIWKYVVPKKPIVGFGVGSFKVFFPTVHKLIINSPYANNRWTFAHNEYLQLLVEQGAIGLGIVLGYIVSLFRRVPKSRIALISVIALSVGLLNSGVNFLFHTTGGILFIIWVVILEKEKGQGELSL